MKDYQTIEYNVKNRVATITLNNPKTMNAISQQMRRELLDATVRIADDDDVRIVILTGAGRGFSSGTDLTEGLAGYENFEQQLQQEYKPLISAIENSSKLYIAAINGVCAGISTGIALVCDLAVMADDACFYIPFAGIGLVPDGGVSYQLVQALGYKRAMQAFVESSRLSAALCLETGLTNKVVPADKLLQETQAWAEKLAKGSPLAQKFGKQCMQRALSGNLGEVIDLESKLQSTTATSEDFSHAVAAFFSKQQVVFKGR